LTDGQATEILSQLFALEERTGQRDNQFVVLQLKLCGVCVFSVHFNGVANQHDVFSSRESPIGCKLIRVSSKRFLTWSTIARPKAITIIMLSNSAVLIGCQFIIVSSKGSMNWQTRSLLKATNRLTLSISIVVIGLMFQVMSNKRFLIDCGIVDVFFLLLSVQSEATDEKKTLKKFRESVAG
jgi:hypothetical protein